MAHENPVPVVRLGRTLVATVGEDLDDASVLAFQTDLAERISASGTVAVIIDLSAVAMVDSFIGRVLADVSLASRLLGAKVIVAGIQPAVAITLVELGLRLPGVQTALSTEVALAQLGIRVDG